MGLGSLLGRRQNRERGLRLLCCLESGSLFGGERAVAGRVGADAFPLPVSRPVPIPSDAGACGGVDWAPIVKRATPVAECIVAVISARPERGGTGRMVPLAVVLFVRVVALVYSF